MRRAPADHPGEVGLDRRSQLVDVIAVEAQACFQPQRIACAETGGDDFGFVQNALSQRLGAFGGKRDLEPILAGVAGARDQAGDPCESDRGHAHERDLRGFGGNTADHRRGGRALQCQQGAVVMLMELHAGRQVGSDVAEVDFLAARIHHQEQFLTAGIRHHQVVEDAARLVGQQRVALTARLQAEQIAGNQPLKRGGCGGASQCRLAHVRDVEQCRMRPAMQVFGQHAPVLYRHRVAGELHHPRTERAVPGVKRHSPQLLGRGIVRQRVFDQWSAPQGSCAGDPCRCR